MLSAMVAPTHGRSTRLTGKTAEQAEDAPRALTATFFCVMQQIKQAAVRSAAEFEVSVAHVRALYALQEPLPMRDLAERLALDPSNITALVDRLEGLGLVERRADSEDRRVKRVVVTPQGVRHREKIVQAVFAKSPVFDVLDEGEQEQLLILLRKLADEPEDRE